VTIARKPVSIDVCDVHRYARAYETKEQDRDVHDEPLSDYTVCRQRIKVSVILKNYALT